ncbi:cysteine hydrolase family protein [Gynuella sunshinyii]|uniref:Amidases-like nicotinamidase n=1 Tax=Gynuella sunshinyii YC6258 TaxID=1445510 RepID=A0A0C5VCC2_9GAMM|nr:cysteine hydrolase family protein [Gynuella sunshinyii]AJQ96995.1 amidases-like nicotinamidase [Gynuella sunshinyii YC6258]
MKDTALIIIDIQNDYFAQGKFPLADSDTVLTRIMQLANQAISASMPVILVQHIGSPGGPFFNPDNEGTEIHPQLKQMLADAPVITKQHADAFWQTDLSSTLEELQIQNLVICGMMTQNCVTHTAISTAADKYQVAVVADCCTTVSTLLHQIALAALKPRIELLESHDIFAG